MKRSAKPRADVADRAQRTSTALGMFTTQGIVSANYSFDASTAIATIEVSPASSSQFSSVSPNMMRSSGEDMT